jgi:hypothetical protein
MVFQFRSLSTSTIMANCLGAFTRQAHDFNDLVVRHKQDDTAANELHRFDQVNRHFTTVVLSRPLFYPNGITLSGDGNSLYVADIIGVYGLTCGTTTFKSQILVGATHWQESMGCIGTKAAWLECGMAPAPTASPAGIFLQRTAREVEEGT